MYDALQARLIFVFSERNTSSKQRFRNELQLRLAWSTILTVSRINSKPIYLIKILPNKLDHVLRLLFANSRQKGAGRLVQ